MAKKPKIPKIKVLQICKEMLWQGNGERGEILAKIGEKWQIADRTFDRYWKQAQKEYFAERAEVDKEKQAERIRLEKKLAKEQVLSRIERMKIASDIAKGSARKIKTGDGAAEIIIPTDGDRIRALTYLSKIDGDFAPEKFDHEIKRPIILSLPEYENTGYPGDAENSGALEE